MAEQIEGFNLSIEQKNYWTFIAQGQTPFVSVEMQVPTDISTEKIKKAIVKTCMEHEILRTHFCILPGMVFPLQVVSEDPSVMFDQGRKQGTDFQSNNGNLLTSKSRICSDFNLEHGPLVNCELTDDLDDNYKLILSLPAFNIDRFTIKDLISAIADNYKNNGSNTSSSELTQYIDFSQWQGELLIDEEVAKYKDYWKRYRQNKQPNIFLPYEKNGSYSVSADTCSLSGQLDSQLTDKLNIIASENNVCPGDLLHCVFHLLFWHLTEQDNIVIYRFIDGRTFDQLDHALGPYCKILPVNMFIDGKETFTQALESLSSLLDELKQPQLLNVYNLEECCNSDQGLFGFHFDSWPDIDCGNDQYLIPSRLHSKENLFRIKLNCLSIGSVIHWQIDYCSSLYSEKDAQCMISYYLALLSGVISNRHKPVGALNYLPDSQIKQRFDFHHALVPDREYCLHNIFSYQAEKTPEATVLIDKTSSCNFRTLQTKSNALAHQLGKHGVGADSKVGLCMLRSCEMIISIIGILKSGAAYVPIDPDFPEDRISSIIQDADVSCVVTEECVLDKLPEQVTALCMDSLDELTPQTGISEITDIEPNNLAYVLYTSGSTGSPKGVEVSHLNVINLLYALEQRIYENFSQTNIRVALNAPITFDASVKQIFQICQGRSLVIVPEEIRLDGSKMWDFLIHNAVNVFDCTPTQWKILAAAGLPELLPEPLCVLLGGEIIDAELWSELMHLQQSRPALSFINLYGPTEATVDSAVTTVKPQVSASSVGNSLPNVQLYILNDFLQPVVTQVKGELYIAGKGVARGYLGQPASTATKFIPDPFSDDSGARMYRSGDLARWNQDGSLEIVGRTDDQIKIRGVRVEPAEIEATIKSLAAIKESTVIAREDNAGDPRLIAYLVPQRCNARMINDFIRYDLPNGMAVVHKNRHETDYVFDEIFTQKSYLQHGIRLPSNGFIIDVGANIGMFSLFASLYSPDSTVLALEPIPELFQLLQLNTELYCKNTKLLPIGLSNEPRSENFTYYSGYTMMSGQSDYLDADSEVAVIKQYLSNQQQQGDSTASVLLENANEILEGKFQSENIEVRLQTLSDLMQEQAIETVDLLKIDVQRAEWDVLCGIRDEDWIRIKQIVMEVHSTEDGDTKDRIEKVTRLLQDSGYDVVVDQHELLTGTDRHNLYAIRQDYHATSFVDTKLDETIIANSLPVSEQAVRNALKKQLPDYLLPTDYVILDDIPLNHSGKVDRQALPAPDKVSTSKENFVLPAHGIQTVIAEVWKDVLHLKQVSVKDNFFDLGGHSLTLIQVHNSLSQKIDKEISILDLFQHPSIELLAEFITGSDDGLQEQQNLKQIHKRAEATRRRRSDLKQQRQNQ